MIINNIIMYADELKNFVISDTTQKYEEINIKILKYVKIYFYVSKNYSSLLNQIEIKINNNYNNNEIKIKQLLDNQHNIIKELIKILNNILIEKINSEVIKKLEAQSFEISDDPYEQKSMTTNVFTQSNYSLDKSIYGQGNKRESITKPSNNNYNIINYNNNFKNNNNNKILKTNVNRSVDNNLISKKLLNQKKIIPLNIITPRTDNEFNGALSFLNININNKFKNYKNNKNYQNKNYKEYSNKPILNSSSYYNNNLRSNNINNKSYYMNNNYTIDEERNDNNSKINERQNSINSKNYYEEEYGNMPDLLNNRRRRIKYRFGKSYSGEKDKHSYIMNNGIGNKTINNIYNKTDSFLNTNSSLPNFTLTTSTERLGDFPQKRSNTYFNFFKPNLSNILNKDNKYVIKSNKTKLYSIPYIYNGTTIKPSKFTKEIYNNSYKKIDKYQKKRLKKSFK